MDPVTPIVGLFQHLADLAFWWQLYQEAAGAAFFPTIALGALGAFILVLWRSPKLPWFTGRLAALVLAGLLTLTGATVLIVAVTRATDAVRAPPTPAAPRSAGARSQSAVDREFEQLMEHTP